MPNDSERLRRVRIAYLQIHNHFVDGLNEHVRPEGAPEILREDVVELEMAFADLLRLVVDWYVDRQADSAETVHFPLFRCGDRTIEPWGNVLEERRFVLQRFAHLGIGWTCAKCGRGEAIEREYCRRCCSHRNEQLEKVDQVTWKSDFVEPMEKHLDEVVGWFGSIDSPLQYRLTVNGLTANLNGKPISLSTNQSAQFLQELLKQPGSWMSGTEIGESCPDLYGTRLDRTKKSLPDPIRALIESKTGSGYRLKIQVGPVT